MENIEAQETVVSALWDFARDQDTMIRNASNKQGTQVNTKAVGKALEKIMNVFGYEVAQI